MAKNNDDDYKARIKNVFKGKQKLRMCLSEIPDISERRIKSMIANKKKNGLDKISWRGEDGMLYCKVDKFITWIEQGMKKAA